MRYRRFGRTELSMPVFSTGGMRYQDSWKDKPLCEIDPENQKNLEATIERSLEVGINHIETARGYGSSERQLGQVLPRFERDSLIVQTKIAPEDDPTVFTKHFEESLDRLNLDYVDLLGLHGINNEQILEPAIRPGGCFEAACKLREQGKVRYIGFSTHASLPVILKAIQYGQPKTGEGFDYVNLHWYFIFQQNWPAILEATKRDMGVFIISPSDKGGKLYQPPEKLITLCDPLSPMVFNNLFCLMHPEVHTLSLGAACPSDYDEHLKAIGQMDQAHELIPPIVERLQKVMLETIGDKDPEAISKTLPEWPDCSQELNFRIMCWLRNLVLGWDMVEYAKMRYNLLGNGGHWFPGTSPDLLDQVSDEDIRNACSTSPYAENIPAMLYESKQLLGGGEVKRLSQQ